MSEQHFFPETESGVIEVLKDIRALLAHDGHPKRPHIRHKGNHIATMLDLQFLKEQTFLFDNWTKSLFEKLRKEGLDSRRVARVLGHGVRASGLSASLAYHIASVNMRECVNSVSEQRLGDKNEAMFIRGKQIDENEGVLLCKDILIEGKGLVKTLEEITRSRGLLLPYLAVIVNASGQTHISGLKIVSLLDYALPPTYTQTNCPFCIAGSPAVSPAAIRSEDWMNATFDPAETLVKF